MKDPSFLNNLKVINLIKSFKNIYRNKPYIIAFAPGRVNLIGEHTDYNEGFVLPVAINRLIYMAAGPREDSGLKIYSLNYNEIFKTELDELIYSKNCKWANYIQAVAGVLLEKKINLRGANLAFGGDIPPGSGLSSSAALEVASIIAFKSLNKFKMDRIRLALACQKAENEFVGVNCGIMDQYISLLGKKNHALFLDSRTLKYKQIPLHLKDYVIMIADSRCHRKLKNSDYNVRRIESEEAFEIFKKYKPRIKSIRDIKIKDLLKYKNKLSIVHAKRIKHVVTENTRVIESVKALENGRLEKFGQLMNESHVSLRDNYEVSSPELDSLVDTAWKIKGVLGSRLTGAGFGGSTVSLVHKSSILDFKEKLTNSYQKSFGKIPYFYTSKAERGAGVYFM